MDLGLAGPDVVGDVALAVQEVADHVPLSRWKSRKCKSRSSPVPPRRGGGLLGPGDTSGLGYAPPMDRALPCLRPWLRFAGIALLALGCGDAPRPNVLLVTIDTLRADRLSGAGHSRQTTPYLDELAASGVRFERAYASSSWTAPSVASLLTSLDPRRHGIEHGHLSEQVIVQQEVIPESLPLWPELLRNAGYRTYGITANTHLYGHFGFDRGFDRYECIGFLTADEVLETLERWQLEITASEPWFVWVHLLDPHARYTPRSPWIDRKSVV